jgi:transposase
VFSVQRISVQQLRRKDMFPALGIDVAKQSLAVALMVDAHQVAYGSFANSPVGFARLVRWVTRQLVNRPCPLSVCLEATGRYGEAVAEALWTVGYHVSVVNPSRIHAYGRSQELLGKSDQRDAKLLALYAGRHELPAWQPPSPQQQARQELSRHLDDLKTARQRLTNRLSAGVRTSFIQRSLQEQIELLTRQIEETQAELDRLIQQDETQRQQFQLLTSIPGIGPTTASKFLAEVGEWTNFESADQLAAYAGLVPKQHQSGTSVHKKPVLVKGGNHHLRTAFYMPALAAERFNPVIAALAARLRQRGKSKMQIIGAIMHKLLRLAFGVLKSGRPFDPNYATGSLSP